ncbi:thiamine biosynthesis protein ApbE [Paenibacillus sp. MY03]|uniref:FAD:protein FMN transferase n=1 Tax=Paenibacillus sp. MY03 TaxID=302980 RepID=UPI000B3D1B41|nr:FAD:protein FMN transferase [Paenibacillus sp. MY03]OUS68320.1 thiamine biosynthesis protein ApbE [Paenibacillus sp. MY03]
MKTIQRKVAIAVLPALIMLLFAAGCGSDSGDKSNAKRSEPQSHTYYIFDTVVTLRVYDDRMTNQHFEEVNEILERIDREMNRQREDSELAEVNAEGGKSAVKVSEETMEVIQAAMVYAHLSEGKFNPAIGPLVDLWRIGNEGASVPEQKLLNEKLELIDFKDVVIDEANRTVRLNRAGMALDLGGIAKGYAADVIADYLKSEGFNSAIIDLGGNIMALGNKPNGSQWNIGIQEPDEQRGQQVGSIKVSNQTVVTSGVYERFFKKDGRLYHHILDTSTGFPVQNGLLSVTLVTNLSIDADALSTTAFAMGAEEGKTFIESLEDAEAIFITENKDIIVTSGLAGRFKLTNKDYRLVE